MEAFLECAIHGLLYSRWCPVAERLRLFERRRMYGVAVQWCRHEDVRGYIGGVLGSSDVQGLLREEQLERLVLAFVQQRTTGEPLVLESYDFALSPLGGGRSGRGEEPASAARDMMLRIGQLPGEPLPEGCEWRLVLHASGDMEASDAFVGAEGPGERCDVAGSFVSPVKAVCIGGTQVQLTRIYADLS